MNCIQKFLVVLSISTLATIANAQDGISFKSTQVADGLYVLEGMGGFAGGNIAVSVGEDGVVLIDDGLSTVLEPLRSALKQITDAPIDFMINTHVHADHVGNNAFFGEAGTHIVAHSNLRERLKVREVEGADGKTLTPASALPVITFDESLTFHLNGGEAHVFHVGPAHTDGDVVIHFRDLNVIHVGDVLFNGIFPFIDLQNGGSVSGYIEAQKILYELLGDDTVIIPGHGAVGTRKDLKAAYKMLEDAQKRIAKLKKKGMSEDEVWAKNPLNKYEAWSWDFITTEKMTRTIYQDLN